MILGRILACVAWSLALPLFGAASSATASAPTSTLRTRAHFAPASAGAKAALAWVNERRAEDPSRTNAELLAPIAAGDVDVELVTTSVGNAPSIDLANGRTMLPSTGTPGQIVAISGCVAHSARVSLTYAWQCDAAVKCGWNLENLKAEESGQVACSSG